MQMSEFMEYIKRLHLKLLGSKYSKKERPRDQQLDYDSIDSVTDLSEEGILTTSMHKLSVPEKQRLKRYIIEQRKKARSELRKHDCGAGLTKPNKKRVKRHVCEMELRNIVVPPEMRDDENSAH